ncbi:MAG: type II secretion system protein [Planctomycetota bacterium]|jgi:prepilin-type N-terminal cleavage/methylation domain-containing protein
MRRRESGFTLIEILVVVSIIATLAGLVSVVIPWAFFKRDVMVCTNNVSQVVGLLESSDSSRYPNEKGPNLLLYLVAKGQVAGRDGLELLFCPGDQEESLGEAGGEAAYADLDFKKLGEYGALTSYAARDQSDPKVRAKKGRVPAVILVADDSEDHHDNRGIVVGLTGGQAKWRDKVDDYDMTSDAPLTVGGGSDIPELQALVGD